MREPGSGLPTGGTPEVSMLHHLSFAVGDLARSAQFYDAVLSPLGYARVWTNEKAIGYGSSGKDEQFALRLSEEELVAPREGFHLAFAAPSPEAVIEFHRAALDHGGKDNGGAGLQPEYGMHYFAAFVFDPDGYRIEAVIHLAPGNGR